MLEYIRRIYSGRINRKYFIQAFLFLAGCVLIISYIIFGPLYDFFYSNVLTGILLVIVNVIGAIYYYSLFVKRFHDLGKSGWNIGLMFVPIVNLIALIYLLLAKGEDEGNKYGPPISSGDELFNIIFDPSIMTKLHDKPKTASRRFGSTD